ncbi:MAG TPA: sn-glycerol-3-phosphate ABC transporter ATP-binding protein UgpC [Gemmatimonadaceae bacterium]|nr:sn-glycerol-3-phosphate ABC transporter ATP-binding protein UgpC [Gemmatimonadaceae bacterium]
MAQVTLEGVRKVYDGAHGHVAVHGVDLDVADGEFVVLVGPSGCGKSTTLRMIAGLESITAGKLSIGGRVVNDVPPKDRDIAMVFQNYALYPHMSVRDNMAFALKLRKLPKTEIDQRVREAAEVLGLTTELDRLPKQLSGGQRQRVAVGRAIVRKPAVFLFDEPLSNLDAKLRVQMRREILALHRRLGATTIYVTHDQVEAMTMGDRIVVMSAGHVMQVDTPEALYEQPSNRFVAGFIGSPAMIFLKGSLTSNGASRFVADGGEPAIALPANVAARAAGSREVVLGIRPEHLRLGSEGPITAEQPALDATVELVEPLGGEALVHVRTGGHELTAKTRARELPDVGDRIQLVADGGRVHLFNAESGEAM